MLEMIEGGQRSEYDHFPPKHMVMIWSQSTSERFWGIAVSISQSRPSIFLGYPSNPASPYFSFAKDDSHQFYFEAPQSL